MTASTRTRRALEIASLGAFALALLGTLLAGTARVFWVGELMANLRWPLGLYAAFVAGWLALTRWRRTAALSLAVAAWHLAPALALSFGAPAPPPESAPRFTIAGVNLWYANKDDARVTAWLEAERPEIVCFFEVSEFWTAALPRLSNVYTERRIFPSPDLDERSRELRRQLESEDHEIVSPYEVRWGTAIFARVPLENVIVHSAPGCPDPFVECDAIVAGRRVHVIALHPERPGAPPRVSRRNALLDYVARTTQWTATSVVVGDLNATLYSPAFDDFVAGAGLIDTRQGFGRLPSWNPPHHIPGHWLDLDHILVREGLATIERGLGPEIGSDHLPAFARLAIVDSSPTH